MSESIILTNQQERFLILDMVNMPKKYSKAAIAQCMVCELNLDRKSAARVLGVTKSYVDNSVAGQNVLLWDERPERKRLLNYLRSKVNLSLVPIRLFLVEDSDETYVLTLDGDLPNRESSVLCEKHYVNLHRRQDVNIKIKTGKYKEVGILLTLYRNLTVKQIIAKSK